MEPLDSILNLPSHLHLADVIKTGQSLTIVLQSQTCRATCPGCGVESNRIHSHYWRTLQDLPLSQWSVVLRVQVVRFRCSYPACHQQTFVEPLTSYAQRYSRRTQRVGQLLTHLGFELGGQAGKRIAILYQLSISRSTILRLVRGNPLSGSENVKVLGVDDWAMCRGERYGTILVDLERRQVVDLLPDTEAATFASWLQTQPQIRVVSRDRSLAYAEGAQQGAPQALQIADRWHLFKNLWDVLVVIYTQHLTALKQLTLALPATPPVLDDELPSVRRKHRPPALLTPIEQARMARRQYWEHIFAQVHQLRAARMSKTKIAKQLGVSLGLVKKYCHLEELPQKQSPKFKPLLIEPYWKPLRQHLLAGVRSTPILLSALTGLGFQGSRSTLYKAIVQLRQELHLASPLLAPKPESPEVLRLSPQRLATWVFAKTLIAPKQTLLQQARDLHPAIELATGLAQDFMYFIRHCLPQHLILWIEAVELTDLSALKQFAQGLLRDFEAVYAACCNPWSNGQVEGQVNRLKFIKRQMYGRANFDLLRLRVLYSGLLCT